MIEIAMIETVAYAQTLCNSGGGNDETFRIGNIVTVAPQKENKAGNVYFIFPDNY
ncbi:MAG: hypothetical protein V4721_10260 [Bacteroidota bacterium]